MIFQSRSFREGHAAPRYASYPPYLCRQLPRIVAIFLLYFGLHFLLSHYRKHVCHNSSLGLQHSTDCRFQVLFRSRCSQSWYRITICASYLTCLYRIPSMIWAFVRRFGSLSMFAIQYAEYSPRSLAPSSIPLHRSIRRSILFLLFPFFCLVLPVIEPFLTFLSNPLDCWIMQPYSCSFSLISSI